MAVLLYERDDRPFLTDNGNYIVDCLINRLPNPAELECKLRAIPGVVGTGLFLDMADIVLIGDENFHLIEERRRTDIAAKKNAPCNSS